MTGTDVDLDFSLRDKTMLVTGGASGIGAEVARAGVVKGARVAVADLDADLADRLAAELATGYGDDRAAGFGCDVSDAGSVQAVVDRVMSRFGRIDVLVNSAGVARLGPAEDLAEGDWDATIAVNLKGTFLMCQAVGRQMIAAGGGRIINLASQAGSVALDRHAAYCASKWAVIGLSRVLALEWGGRGINTNTISPTVVLTELGKKAWDNPAGERHKAEIPVGRFALPQDVAAAVVFLASSGANMINGADLVVDGGFTIH